MYSIKNKTDTMDAMLGVIFDCDGTLIDSEYAHFLSWKSVLNKRGYPFTEEECRPFSGFSGPYVSQKLVEKYPKESPDSLLLEKKQVFLELQKKGFPPIERTVKFLFALANQKEHFNIKLALASAATREEILNHLNQLGCTHFFDAIISGHDDLEEYCDPEGVNKPKPYIYQHAAKSLNLHPTHCAAFEDTHAGVVAASTAGLVTFAVPNAFTQGHDFSKAHYVIEPHEEIDIDLFFSKLTRT
jgi:beta-phosphoglucomutase